MKIILFAVTSIAMIQNVLLVISDQGWISIASMVASLFTFAGVVFVALRQGKQSVKTDAIALKVDGLLEKKALADEALGKLKGIDEAAKEKAIGDDRELEMRRRQELINQPPPQSNTTTSDVKDVKNEIVKTLESEIHKKGEEMKKVVENKSDQIKEEVEKVPDEVVKKLPPK